jgi:hypothetical protein
MSSSKQWPESLLLFGLHNHASGGRIRAVSDGDSEGNNLLQRV